uniref:ATP synthase F0 subunit 8 n=1 Tax=Hypselodoris bullockii TaxID=3244420 RepID=A0A2I6BYK9_9GAST|nr:ATP synthase F0 subunit 8 [Hypselodoris bullocki]
MPQLSPMLGMLIFLIVLFAYTILLSGLSKKMHFVQKTKMSESQKKSFKVF